MVKVVVFFSVFFFPAEKVAFDELHGNLYKSFISRHKFFPKFEAPVVLLGSLFFRLYFGWIFLHPENVNTQNFEAVLVSNTAMSTIIALKL